MYIEKDSVRFFLRLPPSAVFFFDGVFGALLCVRVEGYALPQLARFN